MKQDKDKKRNRTSQLRKKVLKRMERANAKSVAAGRCGLAFLDKLWECDDMRDGEERELCYERAIKFYNDCMDRAGFPK